MREPGSLTIQVLGPVLQEGRIAADDLALLLHSVQAAVERIALVLTGEYGVRKGRRPAHIERLTRLEVAALKPGSVVVALELPWRGQLELFPDLGTAALSAFADGVARLSRQEALPRGWDAGVLMAVREMGGLFRKGVEALEVSHDQLVSGRLTQAEVEFVGTLVTQTVKNRQVVEGRLLMADFKESDRRCRVHPPFGPPVQCTFDDAHRQALLDALTRYVRVTGEADLDPATGRIRQLAIADIEVLEWEGGEEVTYPFWEPLTVDELARIQGVGPVERVEDLAAPIWESDEELEEFLADIYAAREVREDR